MPLPIMLGSMLLRFIMPERSVMPSPMLQAWHAPDHLPDLAGVHAHPLHPLIMPIMGFSSFCSCRLGKLGSVPIRSQGLRQLQPCPLGEPGVRRDGLQMDAAALDDLGAKQLQRCLGEVEIAPLVRKLEANGLLDDAVRFGPLGPQPL